MHPILEYFNNLKQSKQTRDITVDANFVINSTRFSANQRLTEFNSFLNTYSIPNTLTILDSNILRNVDYPIPVTILINFRDDPRSFISVASTKDIVHFWNLFREFNLTIHNSFLSSAYPNAIFLPMFCIENNIQIKDTNKEAVIKHYPYGIYITNYDANSEMLYDVLEDLSIDKDQVLLMDKEDSYKEFNTTRDRNVFFSSAGTILEFSDTYSSRHVSSRFYFECIYNDKPFYIVNLNKSESEPKPHTLMQFKSIKYKKLSDLSSKKFSVFSFDLDKKLIMTSSYIDYIRWVMDPSNQKELFKRQYRYAEDYLDWK